MLLRGLKFSFIKNIKIYVTIIFLFTLMLMPMVPAKADDAGRENKQPAKELKVTATASDKSNMAPILDWSYATTCIFAAPVSITISSSEPIEHLYIQWAKIPSSWDLEYTDGGEVKKVPCGTNGFLHEYVHVGEGSENIISVTLNLPAGSSICNIHAFGQGAVPDSVQVWKPHCDRADMLVLSTHADDEILFLGGVLATYAGGQDLDVQVIYFSDYTNGAVVREHEKLDGLWCVGVRNYPENAGFDDIYAADLAEAEKIFEYDKVLAWVVEMIRKYKPQVCIGQDTNGEYGHGAHQLTSKALLEGVNISAQSDRYPESAKKYGVWDVAKTYIHLYGENKITLNCREVLGGSKAGVSGNTALAVATNAYKQHVSQQWCWFYVSDEYKYSIAEFGLARTNVGADTGNDMMEHIKSYAVQEYEEESRQEESRQEESRLEESRMEQLRQDESVRESESIQRQEHEKQVQSKIIWIIIAAVLIVCGIAALILLASTMRAKKHKRRGNKKSNGKKRR